jgi:hypothetical protein
MRTVADRDVFVYPITIVLDRYGGTYSHAKWTAWNLEYDEIPADAHGGDNQAYDFWDSHRDGLPLGRTSQDWPPPWQYVIGFGKTASEAEADLRAKIAAKEARKTP